MIRLLICDDSAEARSVVRTMLGDEAEIEVVGEAANGEEAVAKAVELSPDVILMDVGMPGLDGIEATKRIGEVLPTARVVAFAGSDDSEVASAMIAAGASAYCVKGAPLWELERAIAGASQPLVRLAHVLSRALPGGIGHLVAREAAELSCAAFAATYLAAPDVALSLAGVAGGVAPDSLSSAPGVVIRAFSESAPARADAREVAELYRLGNAAVGQAFAVPLCADGETLGALLVAMPASVVNELDEELIAAIADLAAASLKSERRLALTYVEARRDALTGLPNRRAFDEAIEALLASGQRSASLVLFDLDEFKAINDSEGHAVGDCVLRDISRVLLRNLRTDEDVFRIGGDEFALIVEAPPAAAERVAERLRTAVINQRRGHALPTLSIGVAGIEVASSAEELLRKADAALYGAKRGGKNQIVVYGGDLEAVRQPEPKPQPIVNEHRAMRVLLVDDDEGLRMLLRTTFEIIDIEVEEAESADAASERIAARPPDVIVLDLKMPGVDGVTYCRALKRGSTTQHIPVVLLTGDEDFSDEDARECGADLLLRKPFSPLELLSTIERLAGGLYEGPFRLITEERPEEQLLIYAQDLRRLLEIERAQRSLLQTAYRETVCALTSALESKDTGTHEHSQRVQRYARELAAELDSRLLEDASLEYGFLLHDVGKIGIPDQILRKPGPLTRAERRLMQTHTLLGEQMLAPVGLLHGEGLKVIRSHHERWDGLGYPDKLGGEEIPIGGRIFAIADALDAMTSTRPYRRPLSWQEAASEISVQSGRQFDPEAVEAFRAREPKLRRIHEELAAAAAA
jgi:diguanylate cyclase (GGDEF)-like protein